MNIILNDNSSMEYSDTGRGNYVFICIHGGGGDRSHLLPQFEYLSTIARAINVDLRGFGKSTALNGFGTIEQYTQDLYELIEQLQLKNKNIILVGHSMGGMVAVELAASFPQLIDSLILISSGIIFPDDARDDEDNFLKKLSGSDFYGTLDNLVNQLLPYKDNRECCDVVKKTFFAASQEQWVVHFKSMMAWDKKAPERLSHCKCPILYIEDNGGCYSDIDKFIGICPQLIVGRTVCSGHFPTIEVPDQINAMITRFFNAEILN